MKIVIIGAAGHHHLALEAMELSPEIALVGAAPGRPEEDISPLSKCAPIFQDWRAMLDKTRPDIAVVNPWFADASAISAECLLRGIHVYSEKPLSTTWEGLDALKSAWKQSGRALGGMFGYRFAPWFRAMRAAVDAGEIGAVRTAHGQKSYRMGVRPAFYRDRALMGGILPWVAIHAIDWVLAFEGNCRWVSAAHSAECNRDNGEMEVTSAVLLGMERGGIATISADFLRPDGSARHDDDRLRLTGTRGMIEVMDGRVYLENERPRRELVLPEKKSAFLAFSTAAMEGRADQFAEDALAATKVALYARDSADADGARMEIQ